MASCVKAIIPISLLFVFLTGLITEPAETDIDAGVGVVEGVVELAPKSAATRSPRNRRYQRREQAGEQEQPGNDPVLIWLEAFNTLQDPADDNTPVILDQVENQFQPRILAVRQHEYVRIRNSDPVYHNVFSYSAVKRFDVGRRPQGVYYDVKFEEQGIVDVFCDIHSNMHAVIYVVSPTTTGWINLRGGDSFQFADLPGGRYNLNAYSPGYQLYTTEVNVDNSVIDVGTIRLVP